MIKQHLSDFKDLWCIDFEFFAPDGQLPNPICLAAKEIRSGRTIKLWRDELRRLAEPPYPMSGDSLIIAYYASAEMGCHLELGWPMPAYLLDLFTEFRNASNGLTPPYGAGLLGALTYYGIDTIDIAQKDAMRHLAMAGGPWSGEEQAKLLDYCLSDVIALENLHRRMANKIDVARALLRGRYMKAVARMERNGIPIDVEALEQLRTYWAEIRGDLIAAVDKSYGVYEASTFKSDRWEDYLAKRRIPWPRLPSGKLKLDDDTFTEMARQYPEVNPLRELRNSLSQLKLESLSVGSGRNRTILSAFRAKTGRNQPSNAKLIFGPAVFFRNLIKPEPNFGLAYVDWCQQEFGIAAALSGDNAMKAAYTSEDPYLAFAKQAGAVPSDATKITHGAIREQYKQCALAVQYGMGTESLALRIGKSSQEAGRLLDTHRRTYSTFWKWSDAALDHAMLYGYLYTVFGWTISIPKSTGKDKPNPRSLRNFPMQANGVEMLGWRVVLLPNTEFVFVRRFTTLY